jgi:nicotinate-nucleotide--dimethylbenzimidazole phosphoribosyltransferase
VSDEAVGWPLVRFAPVHPPDDAVRAEAFRRQDRLTKPAGALGRLEEVGVWMAACQGRCPPSPITRPRVVVFAGDHGVAGAGVSAYPEEVTTQMMGNFLGGGAAVNVLAETAGASVRILDLGVRAPDAAQVPEAVTEYKVRVSSGRIDREDALWQDEVRRALSAGQSVADEEVDSGADLLIAGDMGIGNTTPAAVLISVLSGVEPVATIGRGTGIDDAAWARKAAVVRDARRRAMPYAADPVELLRVAGSADLAAAAGFLAQSAVRRTPVILDGVVTGATALLARALAPGSEAWWIAGHRSAEPAHSVALDQLGLTPLLDLGLRLGEGSGALAALPLVIGSTKVLAEMATFDDAGVSARTEAGSAAPDEP